MRMEKDKKQVGKIIKKETKLLVYVVLCMVVIVLGSSYALFFSVAQNSKNQVVKAGTLKFTYVDGTKITGNEECFKAKTASDVLTSSTCAYDFNIHNDGTLPAVYKISLKVDSDNTMDTSKLKVILKKQSGSAFNALGGFPKAIGKLSAGASVDLYSDTITKGATVVYRVQIFADSDLVDDNDDGDKKISLSIEGTGEVSTTSLNPA